MTKKVAKRGWSLEKFTKSVNAQARRLNVKIGSATQIKKAYEDGLSVRDAVGTFTPKEHPTTIGVGEPRDHAAWFFLLIGG